MLDKNKRYYCEKCGRTKRCQEFYESNNKEKYPDDGCIGQCKECMTMFVNNYEPDTFLWILQEIDVPWIPDEWNKLLITYKDTASSSKSIIGRYLAKMKLIQYKDFRWADTAKLQELKEHQIEQTMKRQGFSAVQIAEQIQKSTVNMPTSENVEVPQYDPESFNGDCLSNGSPVVVETTPPPAGPSYLSAEELGLTADDQMYLGLKWGRAYRPDEWVRLEQLYKEMLDSYDIQTAGHKDTLLLACKASLKSNQLLDLGDIEGAQKAVKMYDTLMKAGNFTAVQNKTDKGEFINSISELVAICEREGFIPRYYIEQPNDKVDETIADNKAYVRSLVMGEMNLGNLIENAVKAMADQEAQEEFKDEDEELNFDDIEKELVVLDDSDFQEVQSFIDSEHDADKELLKQFEEATR